MFLLRFLGLSNCFYITSLAPLSNCRDLLTLNVSPGCSIKNLASMKSCTKLINLKLDRIADKSDGVKPQSLSRLAGFCPSLKHLDLSGCYEDILDLTTLAACTRLRTLHLTFLSSLHASYKAKDLKELQSALPGLKVTFRLPRY